MEKLFKIFSILFLENDDEDVDENKDTTNKIKKQKKIQKIKDYLLVILLTIILTIGGLVYWVESDGEEDVDENEAYSELVDSDYSE